MSLAVIPIRFLCLLGMCVAIPRLVGCGELTCPFEDPTPPPAATAEKEEYTGAPTIVSVYEKRVRMSQPVAQEVSATARKTESGFLWLSAPPAGETAAVAIGADGLTVGKMYQNIEASGKAVFRLDAFLDLGADKVFSESPAGRGREVAAVLQEMPKGAGAAANRTPPGFHAVLTTLRILTCLEASAKAGNPKCQGPDSPFPGGVVPAATADKWKNEEVYVGRGIGPGAADLVLRRLPGGRYQSRWSVADWRTLPEMNETELVPTAAKAVAPAKP